MMKRIIISSVYDLFPMLEENSFNVNSDNIKIYWLILSKIIYLIKLSANHLIEAIWY